MPPGTVEVSDYAYVKRTDITSIHIPSTVARIGEWAFAGCGYVAAVHFETGGQLHTICDYAFASCSSLNMLTFPGTLERIAENAFVDCTALGELHCPARLRSIGDCAFRDCTGLTTVGLNDDLVFIGQMAFSGCERLRRLRLPGIGQASPACHVGWPLEHDLELGEHVFQGCSSITALHLPTGLTTIPLGAFADCVCMTSINLPAGLKFIGPTAFQNCKAVVALNVNDELEYIGFGAFGQCISIESVMLPTSLKAIGGVDVYGDDDGAFAGCTSLARILAPDVFVDGTVKEADGQDALAGLCTVFKGCPALASGLTPFSAVKLPRHRFWHPTMHAWCTAAGRACVLAVLVAELRVDREEVPRLPSLPHELWLLLLEFAPRHELGAPPPPPPPPPPTS